jgi:hypothetical protein
MQMMASPATAVAGVATAALGRTAFVRLYKDLQRAVAKVFIYYFLEKSMKNYYKYQTNPSNMKCTWNDDQNYRK